MLGWSVVTPIDLKAWPALDAYVKRLYARPSVARAFAEERALYVEQLTRHGKSLPKAVPVQAIAAAG